ncbi:hypothetical protein PBI_OKIROE_71 [Mycobacterium phage OkiRoe]|uniref:Uncharacterized protein n=1 Tax=Mycobacterium phage Gengar TaxID=1891963 RepID=A0A1C9EGV8_9CAUD|nr:hypothetical protein PBI_OKIROE_71 [Mycobacterium phage OkiRoe]YP_009282315.1 hypothetical protein SEA_GENGAR_70 [Mycobacterium phage Gengar]AHZ95632.1 hypothetical protein PBI_OKIROE_71 [Mycobacterium phage OkiRoe]AON96725.1 hypothetical protein SEA_GENGAR_70 [Mycobacterium phage Gengar]
MTVGELIAKLRNVNPDLLVATVDGESGEDSNVNVYEVTRHVDRRLAGDAWPPYVGYHPTLQPQERVVLITQWGVGDESDVREL